MLHLILDNKEIFEVNVLSLSIAQGNVEHDKYYKHLDEKWIKFCKEHNFNPHTDANNKVYRLYLDLCAEGLV